MSDLVSKGEHGDLFRQPHPVVGEGDHPGVEALVVTIHGAESVADPATKIWRAQKISIQFFIGSFSNRG